MRNFLLSMLSVLSLSFASTAMAQAKGYLGGLAGMSVPDAENTSARPAYGIIGGARLDGELGLGGFYLNSTNEESANGRTSNFNYAIYGLEGSFHFEGVADGAYLGARVGLSKLSFDQGAGEVNVSPMVWGLHFGYDHFFQENFSAGVEAGFMSVASDSTSLGAITVESEAFTMLNFAASAKFWF